MTIQVKAIEQYFHVALFIMLYKVVVTFQSVDETLVCDHSNESYWTVLSCGIVYYAVQGGSNFYVCGWNPSVWPFKWKLSNNTVLSCDTVFSISCKINYFIYFQIYFIYFKTERMFQKPKCVFTFLLNGVSYAWSNSFIQFDFNSVT